MVPLTMPRTAWMVFAARSVGERPQDGDAARHRGLEPERDTRLTERPPRARDQQARGAPCCRSRRACRRRWRHAPGHRRRGAADELDDDIDVRVVRRPPGHRSPGPSRAATGRASDRDRGRPPHAAPARRCRVPATAARHVGIDQLRGDRTSHAAETKQGDTQRRTRRDGGMHHARSYQGSAVRRRFALDSAAVIPT